MLTLQLTPDNKQITVHANGQESHSFSLLDLGQTDKEWKDFFNDPRPYGGKLFAALFKDGSKARIAFDELSKQSERTIVLILESSDPSTSLRTGLDGIAWEYAFHDNAYIVEDFAFIRALPEKERPHSNGRLSKSVERVPLLFIPANPLVDLSGEPMRELDIESEWREMTQHIVKSKAPFDLIELRPATAASLQSVMARFQNGMIAHFSGHGAATKDGAFLLFENENGSSNPLAAREFVREVKDQAWIGFLSACQSAVAERTAFGNLARELVKAGVPFAFGMQFNLPDLFAPNISGQFYNYLSQGHAVPEAARQARRTVKRENEFYVGMIALYAAHPDEAGKMQWTGSGARRLSAFAAADVSDLPTPSGFIGRQRELMNIGTSLLEKKKPNTVTLHGAGGIGKTALMRQALLRFAPSFESTLAIALDPLPSLESVLGRLERFLNLPSPCSNDTKERERIVRGKLTGKETLLGLDNFETLNYALNDKGSDEEKTAKSLHSFFKYLVANGVTLCVTSREVTGLGGEHIIDIEGLPNDVGGRLFQDNVVRQNHEIYIEKTQQVSEMVGGHPLALRLLASAFDDQVGTPLDQYIENLQSFLPNAHDKWTEEDRHESLRASFDFTMNNLVKTEEGKELQIALSRLSVFVAYFSPIFAAPVIANKWPETKEEEQDENAAKISHALWERGLLERATFPLEEENFYLYRLHPALGLFAKTKLTDTDTFQEIFWQSMNHLAGVAEEEISKSPLLAHITSLAMPDLLIAAEVKKDEDGALMQFRISKLLNQFCLYDDSLQLLQKSRGTNELLNNLQGKSAILSEMAHHYVRRGDLDEATKLLQQSLEIDEGLGRLKGKSGILHEMANISERRGNLDYAMKLYKQSLEISEELDDLMGRSTTLHEMARIQITRGDLDEAMNLYQQSLKLDEELGELRGKSATFSNMAHIYLTWGNLSEAMRLYQQSLEISDELGDLLGKAVALSSIANIYMKREDLDEAMSLYQQSLEIKERIGDLQGKSSTLHQIGTVYLMRSDLDAAMKLYQQAFEIQKVLGDLQGKSATLNDMANISFMRGDLDTAMKFYSESLEIMDELGEYEVKSTTLMNVAQIYLMRGDFDGAIKLSEQSLKIKEKLNDLYGKASALTGMANIYILRGDFDEAMILFQQSLEIAEGLGDLRSKIGTLSGIATLEIQRGNLNEALLISKESFDISSQINDENGEASNLHIMAIIYIMREDLDGAIKLNQQSLDILERLGNLQGKAYMLYSFGVVLFKHDKYRESLESLLSALELRVQLKNHLDIENTVSLLNHFQQTVGNIVFHELWKDVTGSEELPEWLSQSSQQEQGMTAEQFVVGAIQSAREKRHEAEEYFKEAQRLAIDSNAPAELQSLGKVLQRIMIGQKNVDLSALTSELREMVQKVLEG